MPIKEIKPGGLAQSEKAFQHPAGSKWKVRREWREPVDDDTPGPKPLAVAIHVQPLDGGPTVSHVHTFTDVELAAPDFDAAARLNALVQERVDVAHAVAQGRAKLEAERAKW